MVIYDSIKTYNETFNHPTLHPLVSLLDLSKGNPLKRGKFRMDFYAIIIKDSKCGDLRYGLKHYDYDEGSIVFFGPGQVGASEPDGEWHQPYGLALVFHPDLIKGTSLAKHIHEYSFFSYDSSEALHVSEKERTLIDICFGNIETEIKQNIDKHSKKILVANIELLLKYCSRFYDRQFITREMANHQVIEKFKNLLTDYILSDKLQNVGLPTVTYFAEELHLSPNYLGDLLKKETGKTPLELIHLKILDIAKDKVSDSTKSISEIAYELGFKYPQHFTRLFKQKVGVSPNEFRGLN
ncbi:AraC family transcriptional regulator [Lacihabitans sp. CCS-44]|uniref:helix-turn-helix domain-containing protein n=1 Tax=Lacihabitans sp. CCS-44 TaxID=2487331 RepID=UPI0020CE6102|nr:helix-turn-helix transcriptional regulator [Lacihabitans sp. CCS-44]MCP9757206.1 AraC family transcriptional regulator [Lacihabitans sp. CCS-44]